MSSQGGGKLTLVLQCFSGLLSHSQVENDEAHARGEGSNCVSIIDF